MRVAINNSIALLNAAGAIHVHAFQSMSATLTLSAASCCMSMAMRLDKFLKLDSCRFSTKMNLASFLFHRHLFDQGNKFMYAHYRHPPTPPITATIGHPRGVQTLNCTEIEKHHVTVHGESLHCQWGLVSRDGWALVDDSDNWGLTAGAIKDTHIHVNVDTGTSTNMDRSFHTCAYMQTHMHTQYTHAHTHPHPHPHTTPGAEWWDSPNTDDSDW